MKKVPVIAIFDVGKTNKKLLLFNEDYEIVHEESLQLDEIKDEDGFPCEDVEALTNWVRESYNRILQLPGFEIKAVNFSAYGASFVYLDEKGDVIPPLYNYLKPFDQRLQQQFYSAYGGESLVAGQTASPVLGNLNSGMQLYRLKKEMPEKFAAVKYALHLPQYLSYILSGEKNTDITSIGCHTNLWNFQKNNYHSWVTNEGLEEKFAPIKGCGQVAGLTKEGIPAGIGLHDSSAALIPYLTSFSDPFVLLSTGTWCISLNPFNHSPLTREELEQDCLCYLSYEGKPVKASRLFAGYEHEEGVKQLSAIYKKPLEFYKSVKPDTGLIRNLVLLNNDPEERTAGREYSFKGTGQREINSYEEAYHHLMARIIQKQVRSTDLVLKESGVKKVFVDGGFSGNPVYMQLLVQSLPGLKVFGASVPQASALGAALVLHPVWNAGNVPARLIKAETVKE